MLKCSRWLGKHTEFASKQCLFTILSFDTDLRNALIKMRHQSPSHDKLRQDNGCVVYELCIMPNTWISKCQAWPLCDPVKKNPLLTFTCQTINLSSGTGNFNGTTCPPHLKEIRVYLRITISIKLQEYLNAWGWQWHIYVKQLQPMIQLSPTIKIRWLIKIVVCLIVFG